jgi:RNA polymerase sigma-70 factor (ECF subfamily)
MSSPPGRTGFRAQAVAVRGASSGTSNLRRPTLSLHVLPPVVDEQERILAARDGDVLAQQWLVERFTPMIFRFCLRMTQNEQDARDATQDTFFKVLRKIDRYDDQYRFETWLFSIARNTCIDVHRRRKRRSESQERDVAAHGPSPLDITAKRHDADRVHRALANLPEIYREIITLYHLEGLLYREIADLIDLPMGTVMNRLFRARRKLKEALEALDAAESRERRESQARVVGA